MDVKIKNTLIVSGSIAILFFFVSPLHAYVLQGRHVLDLMIEKLGPAESLFVSEKLVFYRMAAAVNEKDAVTGKNNFPPDNTAGDDTPAAQQVGTNPEAPELETLELEGTLRYVFSRAFRSDARTPNSERIHIVVGGQTLTIADSNVVPDTVNRFDLFKDILLYRSREALAERLLQLGVDVSISSLGRFEDKNAFVLGAYYPNDTANQQWVDKDTLLPLRLIIRGVYGADNSDKVEIRYLIWWQIGESRYPSKIEFYQDENLVRVSQAINFEENAIFSEELFDVEHLKVVYPQAPLQPITPAEAEEPSEVQKAIEDFKRIFE
jgi:hypothetical protein